MFASYGTPAGSCTDARALAIDATCNAPASLSVATTACVGQRACTLYANDTQFGGVDPCHGMRKRLVVAATCAGACRERFVLNTTVPVGSNATIVLPLPDAAPPGAGPGAAPMAVTEAGRLIYSNGTFLPGVAAGVAAVRMVDDGFEVVTGGGRYSLALLECAVLQSSAGGGAAPQ